MTQGPLVSRDDRQSLHDLRRHRETLTRLSTERLAANDPFAGFMFADRRCRLGTSFALDLLLRSEALRRMGFEAAAQADLARAADFDPTYPFVTRRLIDADDARSEDAARWVIADPRSGDLLVEAAVQALFDRGCPVVGSVTVDGDRLTGWVISRNKASLTLRIAMGGADGDVALQAGGRQEGGGLARIPIDIRMSGSFDHLSLQADGRPCSSAFVNVRVNPAAAVRRSVSGKPLDERTGGAGASRPASTVTVIVPVYDDVAITGRCLEAIAAQQIPARAVRVIVVDDASPGAEMGRLLMEACERHGFKLIRNDRNLGFIGAVNRALAEVAAGDVVLLNSDVVMPPGTIARLAAAADARPDVGIVNPLTNNGQFNSYPSETAGHALGDETLVARIDRHAATAVPGELIETPGGIGYCMYITRACLDAVGRMPDVYLRGYYEDIEFCLRARERGFAAACAADSYVGHKGTASFKGEKLRLVARNKRAIEMRFRSYKDDLAAFRLADPLRPARAAIEDLAHPLGMAEVIVAGSAGYGPVLETRVKALEQSGVRSIVLAWSIRNGELAAVLKRPGDVEPRQRLYRCEEPEDLDRLAADLSGLRPRRIEIAGSAGPFRPSLQAVLQSGVELGVLLCESLGRAPTLEQGCPARDEPEPCSACVDNFNANWQPHGAGSDLHRAWQQRNVVPAILVAMDDMAQEVAIDLASGAFPDSRYETCFSTRPAGGRARGPARRMLALPYPEPDRGTERLLAAVAATLLRHPGEWNLVLLGSGLDDRRLMSAGNLFVTGPVGDGDYAEALLHYGASALFAPQRWSGYGLVAGLAASAALPKAYFDWSIGAVPAHDPDLAIDPRMCDAKAASTLAMWLDRHAAGGLS